MNNQKNNALVWIDLEMTGLDYFNDTILEIASIVTDSNLNIIDLGPNLVIYQPDDILNRMDNWCIETHTKSGLLKAVKESAISMEQAEQETLYFLQQYCAKGMAPLCGNTIWFDKLFLKKDMPRIVDYLHYRIVDVTAFKIMLGTWSGKKDLGFKKQNSHRALDDIKESIAELQFYREQFINV
ncbi:oligoribonuclease [Candidatus Babeliales bacterium]|nr:oligoribonuclease [Candidatus Babeliales bacterium]